MNEILNTETKRNSRFEHELYDKDIIKYWFRGYIHSDWYLYFIHHLNQIEFQDVEEWIIQIATGCMSFYYNTWIERCTQLNSKKATQNHLERKKLINTITSLRKKYKNKSLSKDSYLFEHKENKWEKMNVTQLKYWITLCNQAIRRVKYCNSTYYGIKKYFSLTKTTENSRTNLLKQFSFTRKKRRIIKYKRGYTHEKESMRRWLSSGTN